MFQINVIVYDRQNKGTIRTGNHAAKQKDKGSEKLGMMGLIVHAEVQYKQLPKDQTVQW